MASSKKAPGGIDLLKFYGGDDDMEDIDEDEDNDISEGSKASPGAEDGEVAATGQVKELQISDGESRDKRSPGVVRLPSHSTEASPSQSVEPADQLASATATEQETTETDDADMASVEEQQEIEVLEKFLPPPPQDACSEELQEKIIKFLMLKKTNGRSFNAEVRNRKEYRNPDFLLHAVTYQDIDQIGSCFRKDVFDPHGYDPSDFYDELEADMKRELERKELERKKNQKVEFSSGGVQPGIVVPTPKISIPSPAVAGAAGVSTNPTITDVAPRDGRQKKKSKWDKVDADQGNVANAGPENLSALSSHAALLSAAKTGGGYSAFAQQRRKEAEDRKSSERRMDRRS